MNHKQYQEFLKDLKYSGWILLGNVIIAIIFVGLIILNLN